MKLGLLLTVCAFAAQANGAQMQGVLADWSCVKQMIQDGREKVLTDNKSCSLSPNYSRSAYGLITADHKGYRLDDTGRAWALRLLKDTHDKDNLKVVVTGDVQGDTIHVANMSEL